MRGLNLPVVRFSAVGNGNAPAGKQCSASGRAGLSGVWLVHQTVRKPVCPETLSAFIVGGLSVLSGIHPFDGHPQNGQFRHCHGIERRSYRGGLFAKLSF